MPKDKKKKSKQDEAAAGGAKKQKKKGKGTTARAAKATRTLKALSDNPLVADIVAAALVGMATALKDSEKARKLAGKAGAELDKMAKSSAKQGNAMWELALNIGRQALDTLGEEAKAGKRGKSR